MIKTYIFAGGENTRWKGDYPKEMAEVDGEPVIVRTLRQCYDRNLEPIVVTHKPEIINYDSEYIRRTSFITNRFPTLAHACNTVDWGDKCIFLLGDVYYTEFAWKVILSVAKLAYGNEVEIFAFRFAKKWHKKLKKSFEETIAGWNSKRGRGKLWETYRAFEDIDIEVHVLSSHFVYIEDRTTDFDTVEEYEEFLCQNKQQ